MCTRAPFPCAAPRCRRGLSIEWLGGCGDDARVVRSRRLARWSALGAACPACGRRSLEARGDPLATPLWGGRWNLHATRTYRRPSDGRGPGSARARNVRSRCRCSMCPAIHITSRSWLRSSSTREPSDPPLRVVFARPRRSQLSRRARRLCGFFTQRSARGARPRTSLQSSVWLNVGDGWGTGFARAQTHETVERGGGERFRARSLFEPRSAHVLRRAPSFPTRSRERPDTSLFAFDRGDTGVTVFERRDENSRARSLARRPTRGGSLARGVEGFRGNDPSAGSPTETLLRLLLPLNDQV